MKPILLIGALGAALLLPACASYEGVRYPALETPRVFEGGGLRRAAFRRDERCDLRNYSRGQIRAVERRYGAARVTALYERYCS